MNFNTLLYQSENGICEITLNRPDVYNAFNDEMSYELQDALKLATKDPLIRVVILSGSGKAFSSGQDLKAIADLGGKRSLSDSLHKRYNPIIKLMRNMPKPIIGKINGVAAGAGCSIALACDYIIASESAVFIEVFVNVGLVLDSGSSYFLPRLIGSARAFEMATTAKKVNAIQAMEWGLINKAVPAEQLDSETSTLAIYYSKAATKAIALMKKMLNKSFHSDLDTMLEYEAYCQEIAGNSEDNLEGVKAFNEKRTAQFTGK